ncbi:MAG TPA: hypothetical protein VFQ53_28045, partial [Kofleriaceae bacterium]|nr:hypothetical protein [Kofleriaceae bacterium]
REELAQKLGPFVDDPERAHDPRLVIPSSMRNARFLLDHDRVAAIVIAGEPPREPTVPAARDASNALACPRPLPPADDDAIGACLGGPSGPGELIEVGRDEVLLRSAAEPDRPASPIKIANVIYAVPLRNPTEGRDELVAVKRDDDASGRTWSLAVYRIEAGRAKLVAESPLYTLTAVETRWIGVDVRDVDIYLDLVSRADSIEVAGLLTARVKDRIRDVVLISPVTVTRRHGKSATGDAGTDPTDTPARTGSAKL